ncbi:LLM class flavin-dependent oxidoreductase [Paraburkholderia tropica]|uniref:LLM class flavin-dependent oxidoreductase n=1 Tax=Paraburkholderia tropica TaxID=92647 RepID=UPI003018131C
MPIEIRGRIPFEGKTATSSTDAGRYAAFFVFPNGAPTADPEVIGRAAREQEALGFDSSLVPQNSARPDVWSVVGWALAATRNLKLVAAHRVGLQQPTLAARTFATLDRLSNGRQLVHIIQGRTDEDMQRDGDFLVKSERYERSAEYLEIFRRELTEQEAFSFEGKFYRIRDAWSAVKPVQHPYGAISLAGTSPAALELAAKHADVYTVGGTSPDEVATHIQRAQDVARPYGKELRFWYGGFNVILGKTDDEAWARAEAVADEVERFKATHEIAPSINAIQVSTAATGGSAQSAQPDREGPIYHRLSRISGHGPTIVGSPQTLVEALLEYYERGVSIITLGGLCELIAGSGPDLLTSEDRALLRATISGLREGVAERDAGRAAAGVGAATFHPGASVAQAVGAAA